MLRLELPSKTMETKRQQESGCHSRPPAPAASSACWVKNIMIEPMVGQTALYNSVSTVQFSQLCRAPEEEGRLETGHPCSSDFSVVIHAVQ
jgi:hypothetical protein